MQQARVAELMPWMSGLLDKALASDLPLRLAIAVAIALAGLWLAKLLSRALDRGMTRFGVDVILRGFLRNLAYAIGLVVTAVAAMDALGVPTTSMLAVMGAAGLGIGLALKDSLSNIASGVMLIALRPFQAGDFVRVADVEGTVETVRVFQTVLRTPDNRSVFLPNSLITTAPIINFTGRGQRRAEVAVGIGYGEDIARARKVLMDLAAADPRVLQEPAHDVLVTALADSSVNLLLRAWLPVDDFIIAQSDLHEAVHRRFREEGIEIPFPQRDMNLRLPEALLERLAAR
ncbi:MAG TPA: mechanosensitive ion channel family protein [Arenimonas sp.]|nr:mechanosensitive ion channel family protein [Arenimonas sp.]